MTRQEYVEEVLKLLKKNEYSLMAKEIIEKLSRQGINLPQGLTQQHLVADLSRLVKNKTLTKVQIFNSKKSGYAYGVTRKKSPIHNRAQKKPVMEETKITSVSLVEAVYSELCGILDNLVAQVPGLKKQLLEALQGQ